MIALLLFSAGLLACQDLELSGEAEAADACFLQIINQAEEPTQIAAAYAGLGDVQAASQWYRQALVDDPASIDARLGWGDLFSHVHQQGDAEALYKEVLELDADNEAALLALARLYASSFDGPAQAMVATLLDTDPDAPAPLLLKARLQLELGQQADATAIIERVLTQEDLTLALRLEALSLRAAVAQLQGQSDNPWLTSISQINPHYGEVYAVTARFYVIRRLYQQAVALLEQAVRTDPQLWRAHSELGLNLLRVNRLEDARRHLQLAYAGDPYSAVTVNTLRLLDTLEGYDSVDTDLLVMRASPEESQALAPYVQRLAEEAAATMAPRYGYRLTRPMIVELYQHHDDFAVRTAGLPGIGILGATFGDVVVMDGPSAKSFAEGFDWASALWHEMAHVVTLNATDNLVSRWFSEGVSVFEEWRFGPSRRNSLPLGFLDAWKQGKLLPVAQLDEGFIRPVYEGQIMVSYVQAGLVCQLINDQYPGGLERMLAVYRAGGDNQAAIETGLGVAPAHLDDSLNTYLDTHWAATADAVQAFQNLAKAAREAFEKEAWAESFEAARAAQALYPGYVEPDSPYLTATLAADKLGDVDSVLLLSRQYFSAGGRDPRVLSLLAAQTSGEEQLAVLEAQALSVPLQSVSRLQLAQALLAADQTAAAVEEFQVLLSLQPHDRAAAHYQLARALSANGQPDDARQQVLLALEIAPRYSEALSLLVELQP